MTTYCPTCERPLDVGDGITVVGLTVYSGEGCRRRLEYGGTVVPLSRGQALILQQLMTSDWASLESIIMLAVSEDADRPEDSARNQVLYLRRKLAQTGLPISIQSSRGAGYRLVWPGRRETPATWVSGIDHVEVVRASNFNGHGRVTPRRRYG